MQYNENDVLTITTASHRYGLTRQAIFLSIRSSRLNAVKVGSIWTFTVKDWNDFVKSKYDRRYSKRKGKLIFSGDKLSSSMVCELLNCDRQRLYYLTRKKQ